MLTLLRTFSAVTIIFAACAVMVWGSAQAQTVPTTDTERGIKLYEQEKFPETINLLKAVTSSAPNNAEAWHFLGLAYLKLEKTKDARKALEMATSLRPNFAPSHISLAYLHLRQNELDLALPEIRTALALDDKIALAHYIYGSASLRQANYEVARREAKITLRLDPKFSSAWLLESEALIAIFDDNAGRYRYSETEPRYRYLREAVLALEAYFQQNPNEPKTEFWREQLQTLRLYTNYPDRVDDNDPDAVYQSNELTTKARIIRKPVPEYPKQSRLQGVEGTVRVRAVFTSDAKVKNILVVGSQDRDLTRAAIKAANKIKFVPATRNGRRVSQFVTIEYYFKFV